MLPSLSLRSAAIQAPAAQGVRWPWLSVPIKEILTLAAIVVVALLLWQVDVGIEINRPPTTPIDTLPSQGSYFDQRPIRKKCRDNLYEEVPSRFTDIGLPIRRDGEVIRSISRAVYLGETCIQALVSAAVIEGEPEYEVSHYNLNVSVPQKDERCVGEDIPHFCEDGPTSFVMVYSRDIDAEDIGTFFEGKMMNEVVEYHEDTRRVRFHVPNRVHEYQLPKFERLRE